MIGLLCGRSNRPRYRSCLFVRSSVPYKPLNRKQKKKQKYFAIILKSGSITHVPIFSLKSQRTSKTYRKRRVFRDDVAYEPAQETDFQKLTYKKYMLVLRDSYGQAATICVLQCSDY